MGKPFNLLGSAPRRTLKAVALQHAVSHRIETQIYFPPSYCSSQTTKLVYTDMETRERSEVGPSSGDTATLMLQPEHSFHIEATITCLGIEEHLSLDVFAGGMSRSSS